MEPRPTAYGEILAAAEAVGMTHRDLTLSRSLRLIAPDGHVLVADFDRAGRAIGARRRDPELAAGHAVRTLPSDNLRERVLAWIGLHAGQRPVAPASASAPESDLGYDPAAHCSNCRGSGEVVDGDPGNPSQCGACLGSGRREDELAASQWHLDNVVPPVESTYSDPAVRDAIMAPASAPERGTDAFDEIARSDQAAADFERDPQRRGSIGPATVREYEDTQRDLLYVHVVKAVGTQEPVYGVHAAPGLMSVDVHGPAGQPVFELGRWDPAEHAHVHLASLSRAEAADLIYALATAFGATSEGR